MEIFWKYIMESGCYIIVGLWIWVSPGLSPGWDFLLCSWTISFTLTVHLLVGWPAIKANCHTSHMQFNTFSDWRRTCHMSWVKTHWLSRKTTTWTFGAHVIRLCTLKQWQICVPVGLISKTPLKLGNISHSSLCREKGFIVAKTSQITKGKNWNILCLQAFE